jgi:hypothetical protein
MAHEMLKDGERFIMPMAFMDAQARDVRDVLAEKYGGGFSPTFADGTPDHTSPHKPGYRFADTDNAARLAALDAYAARSRRMEMAWQRKGAQKQDDVHDAPRTRSLDELRAAAHQAWHDRNKRLSNAWRSR